jgi:hypothetical protein
VTRFWACRKISMSAMGVGVDMVVEGVKVVVSDDAGVEVL